MKKIKRLTEDRLMYVISESVRRILNEMDDGGEEIWDDFHTWDIANYIGAKDIKGNMMVGTHYGDVSFNVNKREQHMIMFFSDSAKARHFCDAIEDATDDYQAMVIPGSHSGVIIGFSPDITWMD